MSSRVSPRSAPRASPCAAAARALAGVALLATGCAFEDGERFGRAGPHDATLRVHVRERVGRGSLDPARARTPLERAVARQLFAGLVELDERGRPRASLATSWVIDPGQRLTLHLRADARFSDGAPVTAHDVVWSWRRALRVSTSAGIAPSDPRLAAAIANGAALAGGTLLRVAAAEPVPARGPPFPVFAGAGDDALAVTAGAFPPGAAVRVIDTNLRAAADEPVALLKAPEGGASGASLAAGEAATVLSLVEVELGAGAGGRGRATQVLLQVRTPEGAAGWAPREALATRVPAIGVVQVVHRGGAEPTLRAGPDPLAAVRATLDDEAAVEVLETAPVNGFARVLDVASGKAGWLEAALLEDSGRERPWFLVECVPADCGAGGAVAGEESAGGAGGAAVRGWVNERDLAFDPGLLDVAAVDERTVEVGLAVDLDRALAAFADPLFRPVPARVVEDNGRAWTQPGTIVTTGPFTLASDEAAHDGVSAGGDDVTLVLVRSPTSFEAERAHLERVELVYLERPTTALHLYRAGELDALLDGALPPALARRLARAKEWVPGAAGGALIAPEIEGLRADVLELRDVRAGPRRDAREAREALGARDGEARDTDGAP